MKDLDNWKHDFAFNGKLNSGSCAKLVPDNHSKIIQKQ